MAKGKRTPEATKIEVASRLLKGEDEEALAKENGVAVSTIRDWKSMYGNRRPKKKVTVKKKVTQPQPAQESVSDKDREIEFWKGAFLTEYERNRTGS